MNKPSKSIVLGGYYLMLKRCVTIRFQLFEYSKYVIIVSEKGKKKG